MIEMKHVLKQWWNEETPITVHSEKNVLRWYPQAGKLQVSRPDWIDEATGEVKTGKTVTLDVAALPPAAAALLSSVSEAVPRAV